MAAKRAGTVVAVQIAPKFGGPGRKKQCCTKRKCTYVDYKYMHDGVHV